MHCSTDFSCPNSTREQKQIPSAQADQQGLCEPKHTLVNHSWQIRCTSPQLRQSQLSLPGAAMKLSSPEHLSNLTSAHHQITPRLPHAHRLLQAAQKGCKTSTSNYTKRQCWHYCSLKSILTKPRSFCTSSNHLHVLISILPVCYLKSRESKCSGRNRSFTTSLKKKKSDTLALIIWTTTPFPFHFGEPQKTTAVTLKICHDVYYEAVMWILLF